jgi:hypothetical protein
MGLVREMVVIEGKIERGFARLRRDGIIAPNLKVGTVTITASHNKNCSHLVSNDRLVGVLRFHPHGERQFQLIYFQSRTYEVDAR